MARDEPTEDAEPDSPPPSPRNGSAWRGRRFGPYEPVAEIARGGMGKGDTLLVQGTGGVALFGLQFAAALGARAIVISSSDEKLTRAKALGGSILINYHDTPDWDVALMKATDGKGASHVLELGGPGTYDRSLRSVASGGKIVQIGVLTGFGPKPDLARLQWENADIIGVTVGSGIPAHTVFGGQDTGRSCQPLPYQ